jgi:hypothetical protein
MCELIATCVESHPNPKRAHLSNVKSITCKKKEKEVDDPKVFSWFLFCFSKGGWVCHVGVVDAKLMLLFLG